MLSSKGSPMIYGLGDRTVRLAADCFVAPGARLIGSVVMEKKASIWFNAVARGDVEIIHIGERSNVQDGCVLHTDEGFPLMIGKGVTVGHNATLHGCEIGDNSLIGMNAVILSGARIGENCLIGSNCLITEGKDIPDNSMVLGSPGKVVKELSEAQMDGLKNSAEGYVARASWYLKELNGDHVE